MHIPTNIRFLFVRHANAAKGPVDLNRTITSEGIDQAKILKRKLGPKKFDLILASSATRTQQTADAILGQQPGDVNVLPALYSTEPKDEWDHALEVITKELGHTDLATYLRHRYANVLHRFGAYAASAVQMEIAKVAVEETAMVVSHYLLINLLIYHLFDNPKVRQFALHHRFDECGAVEIAVGKTSDEVEITIIN